MFFFGGGGEGCGLLLGVGVGVTGKQTMAYLFDGLNLQFLHDEHLLCHVHSLSSTFTGEKEIFYSVYRTHNLTLTDKQ